MSNKINQKINCIKYKKISKKTPPSSNISKKKLIQNGFWIDFRVLQSSVKRSILALHHKIIGLICQWIKMELEHELSRVENKISPHQNHRHRNSVLVFAVIWEWLYIFRENSNQTLFALKISCAVKLAKPHGEQWWEIEAAEF